MSTFQDRHLDIEANGNALFDNPRGRALREYDVERAQILYNVAIVSWFELLFKYRSLTSRGVRPP
jgi:hypothetical protein